MKKKGVNQFGQLVHGLNVGRKDRKNKEVFYQYLKVFS